MYRFYTIPKTETDDAKDMVGITNPQTKDEAVFSVARIVGGQELEADQRAAVLAAYRAQGGKLKA